MSKYFSYNFNKKLSMQKLKKSLLLLALYGITAYASNISDEEAARIAQDAHLSSINALLIFTSQDGLNSGIYHFKQIGIDMEIYNLPFIYTFDSKAKKLEYFIVGNVGYSRVFISKDAEIDLPPNRLNYKNHIRTYTAGLGGGIRYHINEDFSCSGGIELIYSLSGVSIKDPDDDIGDAITDLFKQNYNNNISYKLFGSLEYIPKIQDFKPYARLSYKIFDTKSTFTFDELASFNTQSMLGTLTLGAETNALFSYNTHYLTLQSYLDINNIQGEVADTVQFNNFATLGAVAYWYVNGKPSWIERYFLEVSTVRADGLEGYNIGFGFTLDF